VPKIGIKIQGVKVSAQWRGLQDDIDIIFFYSFFSQVKAKDEDSGSNGKIIYSIVYPRHEDKYFIINNTTGEIFTNYKFKREGSKKAYSLTVKAEDRGRPSLEGVCSFQVHILDINDHVPEFDKSKYFHTMMMDTAPSVSVLRVYATDRDEGENAQVQYLKTSDDCGNFAVNEISGVISLDRTFPAVSIIFPVRGRLICLGT
jgi:hypothetical protein